MNLHTILIVYDLPLVGLPHPHSVYPSIAHATAYGGIFTTLVGDHLRKTQT